MLHLIVLFICDLMLIDCPPIWTPYLSNYYSRNITDDSLKSVSLHSILTDTKKWVKKLEDQYKKADIKVEQLCNSGKVGSEAEDQLGEYTNCLNEIEMHTDNTENQINNATIKTKKDMDLKPQQSSLQTKLENLKNKIGISLLKLDRFRSRK